MEYGLQNYEYHNVLKKQKNITIPVKNGVPSNGELFGEAVIEGRVKTNAKRLPFLIRQGETVDIKTEIPTMLQAPVPKGKVIGSVTYFLKDFQIQRYPVIVTETIKEKTFLWYLKKIFELYALK